MGYPLRFLKLGHTHHITSKCNENKMMLQNRKAKRLFLSVVTKTQNKYKFELNNIMIMDNHFHLKITTVKGGDTIDVIMQYIKSVFAKKYNKIHNREGHFWCGRFKDTVVEHQHNSEIYLNNLIVYFALNPVKAKIVKNPQDYMYSAFNVYMSDKCDLPVEIIKHPDFDFEYVKNQIKEKMETIK